MNPLTLPSGYDISILRNGGEFVVTDPVGLSSGTYIVEVIEATTASNVRKTLQRATNLATGEVSSRTWTTTGWTAFVRATINSADVLGINPALAQVGQIVLTPGGVQQTKIWRLDQARRGLPRTATIASVSGDKITLTTADALKFYQNTQMLNVSYVRIWNASKAPEQSAWIRAHGTSSELLVRTTSDIATWTAGDVIRIGEPPGAGSIASCAAVDISQMLQNRLGAVFRQSGLFVGMTVATTGPGGRLGSVSVTPDGTNGSLFEIYAADTNTGATFGGLASNASIIGQTQLSPISNSNLLFVREVDDGNDTLTVADVRAFAVIV